MALLSSVFSWYKNHTRNEVPPVCLKEVAKTLRPVLKPAEAPLICARPKRGARHLLVFAGYVIRLAPAGSLEDKRAD